MPLIADTNTHTTVPTPDLKCTAPCNVLRGDWNSLPDTVKAWASKQIEMCGPKALHIMDGSRQEDAHIKRLIVDSGVAIPLPKYDNCFFVRTDPHDVARVESKTVICTPTKIDSIPDTAEGVKGQLGYWMSPEDLDKRVQKLFPGCMQGRVMYMIPFSMGPIGGPLSRVGIELTDSAYVAVSMRVMTRVGTAVFDCIRKDGGKFVKGLHSVGQPVKPGTRSAQWPCNPEETLIAHKPETQEIISFGSGYGGNSLLGKKCFALRIGSTLARDQGWLAEHMLIMGLRRKSDGKKFHVAAAFPSACGKTNLAMLCPTIPGYEVTCVGDDIAWLRFNEDGELYAINPENGFFGVAPGTSFESNPMAMKTIFRNTVFTNVAHTADGGVWWEGMTKEAPDDMSDWLGNEWSYKYASGPAAHPNSRFCAPAENCPILDENWEDPKGVKIDAILFGGRRPQGVPLVCEAFDWDHGVFLGASLKSEATAAAEFKGKMVMHDPMSMRPFFGYNFGQYLSHWLSFRNQANLPKIFMVNWFRRSPQGKFLWPGFGDNVRVLDWVIRRCEGDESIAVNTPLGIVPKKGSVNLDGLGNIDWDELFSLPKDFWREELEELRKYFSEQVGASLPKEIGEQLDELEKRLNNS